VAVLEKYQRILQPQVLKPGFAYTKDPMKRLSKILEGYRLLLETIDFQLGCPIGTSRWKSATACFGKDCAGFVLELQPKRIRESRFFRC
jgi:hypothetical protein